MARQIQTVSNSVQGTTTAVVAMQSAVVMAEKQAADRVCQNVNRGFYALIRSQISQKIAKLQSQVDSHLMQLNMQRKQLLAVKKHMEHDYNMLTRQYMKTFNGLNQNLKQRIFELDRPTVDFAVKDIARITNRAKVLPATVPVAQVEALSTSQKLIASNVKYRGKRVVDSMSSFLTDMSDQKQLTDSIMLNERKTHSITPIAVPVVICECNYDGTGSRAVELSMPASQLDERTQLSISNQVNMSINALEWRYASDAEVKNEYVKMLAESEAPQRIKDTMMRLFANSEHNCLTL
ncbi:MAG: hypothetical protein IJ957_08060 [Rikenellaceae bacterium]|nr:hypothetical protein [Rikenellaceae bacterium]